jgi:hypothetical protein
MMSFFTPILAQAAAPQEVTVGGVISALMFIVTAIGSMAMIVAWVMRYGQTGHALPAAQRGVLRVPWGLTVFAVVLSILFMILVLASSLVDEVPVVNNLSPVGPPAEVELQGAANTTTDTNAEPATVPPDSVKPDAASTETAATGTVISKMTQSAADVTESAAQTPPSDSAKKIESEKATAETASGTDKVDAKAATHSNDRSGSCHADGIWRHCPGCVQSRASPSC